MTAKNIKKTGLLVCLVCLLAIIFTPISKSKLENYKKKEREYEHLKNSNDAFVEMCEEYKNDYDNLSKKYEKLEKEYQLYKEKYNENRNLEKELEELKIKKDKYEKLIEEYSSNLDNL